MAHCTHACTRSHARTVRCRTKAVWIRQAKRQRYAAAEKAAAEKAAAEKAAAKKAAVERAAADKAAAARAAAEEAAAKKAAGEKAAAEKAATALFAAKKAAAQKAAEKKLLDMRRIHRAMLQVCERVDGALCVHREKKAVAAGRLRGVGRGRRAYFSNRLAVR